MKVAIINITGGGISGGYRQYLRNVIPMMAAHNDVESILCASPKSLNIQDWCDSAANVRFIDCKSFSLLLRHRDVELMMELRRYSPDVIFLPIERTFCFKNVPIVNMIQNMEPFTNRINGNPFIERIKQRIQYMDAKRAIGRSDRIIAISKFVSDFLVKRWYIPNDKIGLVYHGINVKDSTDSERPDIIPESWDNEFIFTAGSIRPARGLEDLFLAMKYLSFHAENSVRLVIAGECGLSMTSYKKSLESWIKDNNLLDRICWAGSLNENEMSWSYENCELFVMTSRVESFGQIAGEAMAHGCINVSADNPCLPEIFGDTAIYYKAGDSSELAAKIKEVLNMESAQREHLTRLAIVRANKYSWDACVSKTVEELLKASKGSS